MLADKIIEKIAASELEMASMNPDLPGSAESGGGMKPSGLDFIPREVSQAVPSLISALTGGKFDKKLQDALPGLYSASDMGDDSRLKRRTEAMVSGGPSWMQDPGHATTEFKNKLLEQNRRLNRVISKRFSERGDGTFFDNVLGQTVNSNQRNATIGHLKNIADRERSRWMADLANQVDTGKYVYDPITGTQKLIQTPGNSPGDEAYKKFREDVRKQAGGRGLLGRMLMPYRVNGVSMRSSTPRLSEDDIRRMYTQYLSK